MKRRTEGEILRRGVYPERSRRAPQNDTYQNQIDKLPVGLEKEAASLYRSHAEVEKCGGDFLDDLFHLTIRRMKRSRIVRAAPFNCVRQHFCLVGIYQVPAEGIIVGRAGGRVQPDRLLHGIDTTPYRFDSVAHAIGQLDR
jgi:hypothetical protein